MTNVSGKTSLIQPSGTQNSSQNQTSQAIDRRPTRPVVQTIQ